MSNTNPTNKLLAKGVRIPEWTFFDRLTKARTSAGLEQMELAELTGISRATISAAENGHRHPSRATVNLWALATGVPVEWLETGVHPPGLEPGTHWFRGRMRTLSFAPPRYIGDSSDDAA